MQLTCATGPVQANRVHSGNLCCSLRLWHGASGEREGTAAGRGSPLTRRWPATRRGERAGNARPAVAAHDICCSRLLTRVSPPSCPAHPPEGWRPACHPASAGERHQAERAVRHDFLRAVPATGEEGRGEDGAPAVAVDPAARTLRFCKAASAVAALLPRAARACMSLSVVVCEGICTHACCARSSEDPLH